MSTPERAHEVIELHADAKVPEVGAIVVVDYEPWAEHIGVVTEVRGGVVVIERLYSPRGVRYDGTFRFWHEDTRPVFGWSAAQISALLRHEGVQP